MGETKHPWNLDFMPTCGTIDFTRNVGKPWEKIDGNHGPCRIYGTFTKCRQTMYHRFLHIPWKNSPHVFFRNPIQHGGLFEWRSVLQHAVVKGEGRYDLYTPLKIDILNPKWGWIEDDVPFQTGNFQVNPPLNFPWCKWTSFTFDFCWRGYSSYLKSMGLLIFLRSVFVTVFS